MLNQLDQIDLLGSSKLSIKGKQDILSESFQLSLRVNFPMPECLCATPDGTCLISGHQDGSIRLWDLKDTTKSYLYQTHSCRITFLGATTKYLISTSQDEVIKVWAFQTKALYFQIKSEALCLAVHPNDKYFIIGNNQGEISVCSFDGGALISVLQGHINTVSCLSLTPDCKFLVSGSQDKSFKLWDLESFSFVYSLEGHTETLSCITVINHYIITGSWDATIGIWDIDSKNLIKRLTGHTKDIVQVIANENFIITGSFDKTIKVWSMQTFQLEFTFNIEHLTKGLVLIENFIASVSVDRNIRIWDLSTRKLDRILTGHFFDVKDISVSSDRRFAVSTGKDRSIRIWDLESKKQVGLLTGHTDIVLKGNFSKNGKFIVSISNDKTTRIWEIATSKELLRVQTVDVGMKAILDCDVHQNFMVLILKSFEYQIWDMLTKSLLYKFSRKLKLLLEYQKKIRLK